MINVNVSATDGATVYGEAGNDRVLLDGGATGFGGVGDDTFAVYAFLSDDAGPVVLTTGAGADTVEVLVRNAYNAEPDTPYLQIADFDRTEDVVQIGSWGAANNPVSGFEIIEAPGGTYTDSRVSFDAPSWQEPGIAVIRLEGTTGITADDFVIS